MSKDALPLLSESTKKHLEAISRAEFTTATKAYLLEQRIQANFKLAKALPVERLIAEHTQQIDEIITKAWQLCVPESAPIALLAVGGYGRAEMYPHSDIDVLCCADENNQTHWQTELSDFFNVVWDCGLKLSHAVRSVSQCIEASQLDVATYTALLEARLLAGDAQQLVAFNVAMKDPLIYGATEYLQAKQSEQVHRHLRFNNTADNLEPNLKEGPGGLRDFHTLTWLAKKLYAVESLAGLVPLGLLGDSEWDSLLRNWRIVARLRFALHANSKRVEERLVFDQQRQLAELFGLQDTSESLAIEQLMQEFFRSAAILLRINDRLLQRFGEHLALQPKTERIHPKYSLRNGFLLADNNQFVQQDTQAILELFDVWGGLSRCNGLHSDTARGLAEALTSIEPYALQPEAVRAQFVELIRQAHGLQSIQRMARLGVLARYLPEFGRVTGRMQYDLFHVYTVDQHTLNVLDFIKRFAQGAQAGFSLPHEVIPRLRKFHLLVLAGLFHDIAKGRGGDHAELGAEDVLQFSLAHQLPNADTQLLQWLVQEHLIMSFTAQKFDISDPQVIHDFARKVADREHLDYLYVLTCADIAGTSPKLWNAWKDQLLADLYTATRYVLRVGLEHPLNADAIRDECKQMALAKLLQSDFAENDILEVWKNFPEDAFLRYRPDQLVWQTQGILMNEDLPSQILVRELGNQDSLEIFIRSADKDGMFSGLMATLDRLNLSVVHARLLLGADKFALDNFITVKGNHTPENKRIVQTLTAALKDPAQIKPAKHLLPTQLKHFKTALRIEFTQHAESSRTQMSIVCADRPGLLADIAFVLLQNKIRVYDARIATFGERAEDMFMITDRENNALMDEQKCQQLRAALLNYLEGRKK